MSEPWHSIQFAVNAQIPARFGGVEGDAIYIGVIIRVWTRFRAYVRCQILRGVL